MTRMRFGLIHMWFVFAMAVCAIAPAWASNWLLVGDNIDKTTTRFVNKDNIRRDGNRIGYWEARVSIKEHRACDMSVVYVEGDCRANRYRLTDYECIKFGEKTVKGNYGTDWLIPRERSLSGAALKLACSERAVREWPDIAFDSPDLMIQAVQNVLKKAREKERQARGTPF